MELKKKTLNGIRKSSPFIDKRMTNLPLFLIPIFILFLVGCTVEIPPELKENIEKLTVEYESPLNKECNSYFASSKYLWGDCVFILNGTTHGNEEGTIKFTTENTNWRTYIPKGLYVIEMYSYNETNVTLNGMTYEVKNNSTVLNKFNESHMLLYNMSGNITLNYKLGQSDNMFFIITEWLDYKNISEITSTNNTTSWDVLEEYGGKTSQSRVGENNSKNVIIQKITKNYIIQNNTYVTNITVINTTVNNESENETTEEVNTLFELLKPKENASIMDTNNSSQELLNANNTSPPRVLEEKDGYPLWMYLLLGGVIIVMIILAIRAYNRNKVINYGI